MELVEFFIALVLFGTIGIASMVVYQVALRSANASMLPSSVIGRVRWWRTHSMAAFVLSACLLLAGFLGLLLL